MTDQTAGPDRKLASVMRLHPDLPDFMRLRVAGQASRMACDALQQRCGLALPALVAVAAGLKMLSRALERGQAQLVASALEANIVCAVIDRGDIMEMETLRSELMRKLGKVA